MEMVRKHLIGTGFLPARELRWTLLNYAASAVATCAVGTAVLRPLVLSLQHYSKLELRSCCLARRRRVPCRVLYGKLNKMMDDCFFVHFTGKVGFSKV
jgi:hypothetical protein